MSRSSRFRLIVGTVVLVFALTPALVPANVKCSNCESYRCVEDVDGHKACWMGPGYCVAGGGAC
jgi:hypothetical protein